MIESKKQTFIILKEIPTLLNRLYKPICRNNKPSIIKDKKAEKFMQYVRIEALKQKCKIIIDKKVAVKIDLHIAVLKGRKKEPDIDGVLKLLLDGLEGVMYKDDKQILDLHIRKHLDQKETEIIVMVEEIL